MSKDTRDNNPYASPQAATDWLVKRRRTFRIGREEIHTIIVDTSLFTGLKTHTVDAAGTSSPKLRGTCRFPVGQREEHQVSVELDAMQRVNLLVDDKLIEKNLFPRMRVKIFALTCVFILVLTIIAVIGAMVLFKGINA